MDQVNKQVLGTEDEDMPPGYEMSLMLVQNKLRHEHEQLIKLLKKYNINKDNSECWYKLATALAKEYVKGFDGNKPIKRRIPKWSNHDYLLLIQQHSERKMQSPRKPDLKIFEELSHESPWKEKNVGAKILQNRFYEGKKDLAQKPS